MGRREGPGCKKFAIAPYYSEDEDYLIAVAFVSVTVDPIRGVGQKSENVWTRVRKKFCLLQQSKLGSDTYYTRNKESIKKRWKKRISKSVQLWNKHYRLLKGMNKSGWNEDKYVEEASAIYQSDTGKVFRFAKCVPVLRKLPKFDPMVVDPKVVSPPATKSSSHPPSNDGFYSCDKEDDALETTEEEETRRKKKPAPVNNRASPQGSNLERPMGMKKAKLIKKLRMQEFFPWEHRYHCCLPLAIRIRLLTVSWSRCLPQQRILLQQ